MITRKQLELGTLIDGGATILIDASTLGLAPGDWPERLILQEDDGSYKSFVRARHARVGYDEIYSFNYRSGSEQLCVQND